MVRIGQLNAQTAYVVQVELRAIADRLGLDVILMQEPYLVRSDLPGFSGWKRFYAGDGSRAAIICRKSVETVFVRQVSDTHHVVVSVRVCDDTVYLVSSYFQFQDEPEVRVARWDRIVRAISDSSIIIGADVNSTLWNCPETDQRGSCVEDFLAHYEFDVFNREGFAPTFQEQIIPGRVCLGTNIDVTIDRNANGLISDWSVVDDSSQ